MGRAAPTALWFGRFTSGLSSEESRRDMALGNDLNGEVQALHVLRPLRSRVR